MHQDTKVNVDKHPVGSHTKYIMPYLVPIELSFMLAFDGAHDSVFIAEALDSVLTLGEKEDA